MQNTRQEKQVRFYFSSICLCESPFFFNIFWAEWMFILCVHLDLNDTFKEIWIQRQSVQNKSKLCFIGVVFAQCRQDFVETWAWYKRVAVETNQSARGSLNFKLVNIWQLFAIIYIWRSLDTNTTSACKNTEPIWKRPLNTKIKCIFNCFSDLKAQFPSDLSAQCNLKFAPGL